MTSLESGLRIEYFGGSFNPLTLGGILMADELFTRDMADRVIFSPCGVHAFGKTYEVPDEVRIDLLQMGINELNRKWLPQDKLAVLWKGELNRETTSESYAALLKLRGIFPQTILRCLIGGDILETLKKWTDWEKIAQEFGFDIFEREGSSLDWVPDGSRVISGRLVNGASSKLKERIKQGHSVEGWVLTEQELYMRRRGIYGFVATQDGL